MSLKYEPASEPLRLDARLAALGSFVCRRVQHPDVRTMPFDISRQLVGVALLGDLWNLKRRNRMMPFDISRRGVQMPPRPDLAQAETDAKVSSRGFPLLLKLTEVPLLL